MFIKIILLIIVIGNCSDTVLNKQCTCTQIQNETDCGRTTCKYENGQCKTRDQETYCQIPTIIAQCPVTGCALYQNTCQAFAGCTAYIGQTYDVCKKISNLCTSDGDRCVTLAKCNTYKTKTSCNVDLNNKYCYYDEVTDKANPTCRDILTCAELPTTLKTDDQCRSYISTCTVNDKNAGCVDSGKDCSDQKTTQQCVTNSAKTVTCVWNTKTTACMDYTCANGTYTTFDECQKYKSSCTLSEAKTECTDIVDCANYKSSDTCKLGLSGTCMWINEKCVNYTCDQASDDYTNDALCTKFLKTCTVDDDGLGCKNKAKICADYKTKQQCIIDLNNNQCYWNNNKNKCTDYNCDNADVTTYTSDTCNMFLSICKVNTASNLCIVKACTDALTQTLCQKLSCLWQDNACLDYVCSNAPTSLSTTTQCDSFKKGCFTNGAGCSDTGTCSDIKTNASCTTDSQNQRCIWLNSACKVKQCTDIVYVSHSECNTELDLCTTDGTKCITKLDKCSSYTAQVSCIQAKEGPCLWYSGVCYLYVSCSSLPLTTHQQCNAANKYCTTDGTTCVPISSCSQTQQTGCYVGTDGECVRNLDSTQTTVCQKFTKCSALNYTTHFQCNREKSTCTVAADKKTCMDLQSLCTGYTIQDNCEITSANKICQWDTDKCRDQKCTDIIKSTYSDCQAINTSCTTDGSKCIDIQKCSSYTTTDVCKYGIDGQCIFDTPTTKCRLKLCSDITDIKSCSTLNNCLSDTEVNKCVTKSTCATYTTATSCGQDGTDGICTWDSTNKKCSLMTKCEDASSFEIACRKKSTICKWTPKPSNGGASSCKQYTCTSKNTGSTCLPLDAFSGTEYQVCAEIQLTCQAASISDLTEDTCFINSAYTYYWDKTTNKCLACNGTSVTNSTTQENSYSYVIIVFNLFVLLLY